MRIGIRSTGGPGSARACPAARPHWQAWPQGPSDESEPRSHLVTATVRSRTRNQVIVEENSKIPCVFILLSQGQSSEVSSAMLLNPHDIFNAGIESGIPASRHAAQTCPMQHHTGSRGEGAYACVRSPLRVPVVKAC
eukprot:755579-Hanusia_phi.AAC.5